MIKVTIPPKQIICTEFEGGEGILVDLQTKRYYQLNETALLVWQALEHGDALEDIVGKLTTVYDIGLAHARTSIENLLARLESYRLVHFE